MKIRTDFVTNSSSSSFSVMITLINAKGQKTKLYEDSSDYCEDFSSLKFCGNPKKIALGFDSVKELCKYLSDSIHKDYEDQYDEDEDENDTTDYFQEEEDAFVRESVQTFKSLNDIAKIEIEYDAFATGEGYEFVADADLYKMTIDMNEKSCKVFHHGYKDPFADMDEIEDEWYEDENKEEWEETISWDKNDKWTKEDENKQEDDYSYNETRYGYYGSLYEEYDDDDEDVDEYQFNDFPVVGTQYENRNERIEKLRVGDPVELVREPDNQYDSNAILVRTRDGSLGYISSEHSSLIAPLLDSGEFTCKAEVTTVIPLSKRSKKCKSSILEISFQLTRK